MRALGKSSFALLGVASSLLVTSAILTGCAEPCVPDELEPNDTRETAAELQSFSDSGTSQLFHLTLHDAGDEDWFTFPILDQGLDGNPEVWITVEGDGAAELELSGTFTCSDGGGGGTVGEPIAEEPSIHFTTSCPGGGLFDDDDSGTLVLHVKQHGHAAMCMTYDLRISVD